VSHLGPRRRPVMLAMCGAMVAAAVVAGCASRGPRTAKRGAPAPAADDSRTNTPAAPAAPEPAPAPPSPPAPTSRDLGPLSDTWDYALCLGNGGVWHRRVRVTVSNGSDQAVAGAPLDVPVGDGAGHIPLRGARAESVRLVDAREREMLFAVTDRNGQLVRRGTIGDDFVLSLPVECAPRSRATYTVYFDNRSAWAPPDMLSPSSRSLNGGLETGTGGLPAGWRVKDVDDAHRVAWSTEEPHGGARCVRTDVGAGANHSWVAAYKGGLNAIGGATYRFEGWVRASGVEGYAGWYIHVNSGTEGLVVNKVINGGGGTYGWKKLTAEFTVPADGGSVTVGTVLRGTGSAWHDDVALATDATSTLSAEVGPVERLGDGELAPAAKWPPITDAAKPRHDHRVPVRVVNAGARPGAGLLVHLDMAGLRRGRYSPELIRVCGPDGVTPVAHAVLGDSALLQCTVPARTTQFYYAYLARRGVPPVGPDDLARLLGSKKGAASFAQGSEIPSDHVFVERAAADAESMDRLVKGAANLVKNPGFEKGGALPEEWPGGAEGAGPGGTTYAIDPKGHRGSRSVRVRVPHDAARAWVGWRQDVPVTAGRTYLYGAWVKCEDLRNGGVQLHAHYRDARGQLCGPRFTSAGSAISGTRDWTWMSGTFTMPPDVATFQVHLTMNATGTAWHDDVIVAEVAEASVAPMQARPGASSGIVRVWPVNAIVKVFPQDLPPKRVPRASISVARNEAEPLQLAVRSPELLGEVRAIVEPPRSADGATLDDVELGVVGYVPVDYPTRYYRSESPAWHRKLPTGSGGCDGWTGLWPDPLLPTDRFDVYADQTRAAWVTVRVAKTARPGAYRGAVRFEANGRQLTRVPFDVRVHDFALGDRRNVAAIYDVRLTGHWGADENARSRVMRTMADNRLAADRIHAEPKFTYAGGVARADFTAYDREARSYFDELRMPFSYTPRFFYCFGWAHPPKRVCGEDPYPGGHPYEGHDRGELRPEYVKAYQACLKLYWEHMKDKGWADRIVLYISDEPHYRHDHIKRQMIALCEMIHGVDEAIPIYSSTWGHCPEWDGHLDVWGVGHYGRFPTSVMEERRRAGDRIWFTTDGQMCTDTPYCAIERMLPHYCFAHGAEAYEFWGVGWLTYDPYEYGWHSYIGQSDSPGSHYYVRYPNGDGFLLYPGGLKGHDRPVSSVRFEQAREGVEDYEYLLLLRTRAERAEAAGCDASSARAVLAMAARLVPVPNAGGRYSTKILPEPDVVPLLKEAIAREIERLRE